MGPGQMYGACVRETERFVRGAGFTDAVIGLSGGVDSSLVAVIAADALGASHVHGVLMPGPYSSAHSVADARALADALGIAAAEVPITGPYRAFAEAIEAGTGEPLAGLAAENTQARCRMVVVMALSNRHGWMMLNTGNKSEAAMGYSTLYGDTAGAFAPIGGVYKTQVYELCAWRNAEAAARGEAAPIPQHVLDKPPSAELAAGQTDEAALGMGYPMLDGILLELVERGRSADEAAALGFPRALVDEVARRYAASAFKRALEPPYADAGFYA